MPELERGGGNPVDTIFGTTTVTVSAATTVTLDTSISDNFRVVLQASGATLAFGAVTYPNNAFTDGTEVILALVQDATGSRTVAAFPTSLRFTGGTTPTLTTTANRADYFRFKYVAASGLFEEMSFLQNVPVV